MRVEKSHNREFLVDIIAQATGRKPLEFQARDLAGNLTTFVRMPSHGEFSVRLKTPAPARVRVEMDNVILLEAQVGAGEHTLSTTDQGMPFYFGDPDSREARAVMDAARAALAESNPADQAEDASDEAEPRAKAHLPALDPSRPTAPSKNLVVVWVGFTQFKPANGPELPPGDVDQLFFQLNTPRDHSQAMADNLSRVDIPTDGEGLYEFLDDEGGEKRLPFPKRLCVTCKGKH